MLIKIEHLKAAALFVDPRLDRTPVCNTVNVTTFVGKTFLWASNSFSLYLQFLGDTEEVYNLKISADEIKILKTKEVDTDHKYFEEGHHNAAEMLNRVGLRPLHFDRDTPAVCDLSVDQLVLVKKAAKTLKHPHPDWHFIHRANDETLPAIVSLDSDTLVLLMPLRERDRKPFAKPVWAPEPE